ncbi:hypothetical protein BKA69DRAFT_834189 [Paraphysoderma sedebokerense]|nr:hypothetical protein BKA69DRAFT_834189 [Paraphysoderma sedebokerense]
MEDKDEMLIFDIGDVDMDNRLSVKITNIRINGSLFHVDRQSGIRNTVAIGEGSELPGPPFRIVYAPALNYYTRDSSSYQRFNVVVTDLATGGVSFTSEIQFPVIPENDPPTLSCNPQAFDLSPDFLTGVTDFYSIQLTANDFDDSFLQYILSEIPPKGEFYTDKKELIQANSPFNSTSLAYHLKDSGGSYPFPTFTAYAMDSQGAISNNCTFMLTIDCPPGRYNNIFRNNSGAICEFCPEGATCSHDGKLPPQPKYGHWKSDQNFSFLPCIPAQACPGSAEIKCSPGYEGTRCGQCTKGYYRLGDSCLRCTEGNWLPIVIALACIIFFGPVLLLYFHSRWNGPSFAIVGIGINFIQTILILRQLQLDWPPEFHAVANMIMVVNFNIDFTSPECYLFEESLNFSTRMKLSLVIPLALIGFIAIAIWIRWIALVVHRMYTSSSITTTNGSRFLQFVRVVNVLLTFVYMSVATHSLALFDCTQESDGRIYLDADPSLRCYEDWWYNDRLYAVPAVCVYVVGIPAYFSFMSYAIYQTKYKRTFWLKSKEIAKQIVHRDSSFKPEYQFFIVLQLCQKLLLVMFSMFLTRYIGLQIILNLAVLQISFLSILKYKPYKYNSLNLLEVLSHVSAMAILSFGLPFHVDKSTTDGYKSSLMLFILIIIFGFIFILLCVLVYELHQRIRMRGSNPKGSEKAGHQNPKLLR